MIYNRRIKEAQRVTLIGSIANLILSAGKIITGIYGKSSAMLADGIHSLSDLVTDVIVIVFLKLSGKESDKDHAYGHGKYETFATLLIAIALKVVAICIFAESLDKIIAAIKGEILPQPESIAFWVALVSILIKEILYLYTMRVGKKINSNTIIANGWHHRSDAYSSIGTAIGIGGAIILGGQWSILDPIAGLLVSILIIRIAIHLALPSINELLEQSLPDQKCNEIVEIITSNKKVLSYHKLRTRKIGYTFAIDVHIQLDKNITFIESHNVTREVEKSLKERFGTNIFVYIHAEPK